MNSQAQREREFSEDLDRVVAGLAPGTEFSEDRDYQTSLQFARGMAEVPPRISPEFRAALKARLLAKAFEESAPSRSLMRSFINLLKQPAWQAVAAVIVLAAAGLIVWASVGHFPQTSPVAPGAVVAATGKTDKASYLEGEPVRIFVELRNVSAKPYDVRQFPPILSIMDDANNQAVYTFKAGQETITLLPGQTSSYVFHWDQSDASGSYVVPGKYHVELEDLDSQGSPVQLRLSSPVKFEIKTY